MILSLMNGGAILLACRDFGWFRSDFAARLLHCSANCGGRTNRLINSARGFKRVKVLARDVVLPFLIQVCANMAILTAWTVRAPISWERTIIERDSYGRPSRSIGRCVSSHTTPFIMTLLAINGVALVLALWQAYVARNITTEFSESKYIAMATVCIFQALFIGVPVIIIVRELPMVRLFLLSGINFIICVSILLLIFIPKIAVMRKELSKEYDSQESTWLASTMMEADVPNEDKRLSLIESLRRRGSVILGFLSSLFRATLSKSDIEEDRVEENRMENEE